MEATDASNKAHAKSMAEALLQKNLEEYTFTNVCFKDNCPVPIIEESQKLEVARLVRDAGKKVIIRDSELVIRDVMKKFGSTFTYEIHKET